jgi:hypothetical protein
MEGKCEFISAPLFPIPVGIYNFGENNHDLNVSLVEDILKEMSIDKSGEDHSNAGGWHSKPDLEKKYKSFSELETILSECGNHYCETYGYKTGLVCSDLWANVNKNGDFNFPHHHGTTALAGVYYPIESIVKDEWNYHYYAGNPLKGGTWNNNDGGTLVLQDPSYGKKVQLLTDSKTPYNIDFYHLYPAPSLLILFPTYLLHMVTPFKDKDKMRLSVSFSFKYGQN